MSSGLASLPASAFPAASEVAPRRLEKSLDYNAQAAQDLQKPKRGGVPTARLDSHGLVRFTSQTSSRRVPTPVGKSSDARLESSDGLRRTFMDQYVLRTIGVPTPVGKSSDGVGKNSDVSLEASMD